MVCQIEKFGNEMAAALDAMLNKTGDMTDDQIKRPVRHADKTACSIEEDVTKPVGWGR